ncbi:class F sortase [Arthrobacter sp. ISL-85]|uniref:class F sortase n=1 Tax=Arthrobacter sp. ISL-85 TaxID=2819115 RepID=UPI001BECBF05|nr:class F sortase [Arthrobacter sp. ISL-85]MBT2566241.1 class F sortase [Arthrobacter sp. ISL-85]
MGTENSSRRGRFIASAAAALLLAGGVTTIGLGLHAQPPTPATTGSVDPTVPPASAPAAASPAPDTTPPATIPSTAPPAPVAGSAPDGALPASVPVRLEVPSIGIDAALIPLGNQPNGEVQTPPGEPGSPGGWYKDSPTPGQTGSAIILGHVNTTTSDIGLFYRLHELTPGQTITVTRADHTAGVFTVDKVDVYHKATFPTVEVYQNADRPEVRLITCGGYNPATRKYLDNTVVYAHLTTSHPA